MKYYLEDVREVFKRTESSENGLSQSEAERRLEKYGKNKLAQAKQKSLVRRFFEQLADPMIIILIVAAVISAVTTVYEGKVSGSPSFPTDTVIILAVVLINAVLGVLQESKAEKAIEALQEMSAATSKVIREGKIMTVKSEDLTVGDVVVLEAGDAVPADCRIFESASLKIEEAALTGESVPVSKIISVLGAGDGGDIPLNDSLSMRVKDFPELSFFKGQTLIVTDGTTLLGADDKAGVAEIMTAAAWLLAHPEIPHGKIRIGFTPDEEIGRGVDFFDVKRFGARFAYTVDGGFEGELEYENFNAASARIVVQGRNIHPGYAKDKMINALQVACEINSLLPAVQRPEHTQDYEGFYHLVGLSGTVEKASMEYIVRDHSRELFEEKKRFLADAVALLSRKYGEGTILLTVKDQYYNMREQVEPYPEVIGKAMQAMREAGVEPIVRPIRGGTDGARLSYMGLPCPNLFTGGMNFHGKFEYCSLDTMGRAVRTILNLARLWAE